MSPSAADQSGHRSAVAAAFSRQRLTELLLVLVASAAVVAGATVNNPRPVQADTASYAHQVLLRAGRSEPVAMSEVATWHCPRQLDTTVSRCKAAKRITPDPRYTAIFAGRPLWAWSAVPFVQARGLDGLYIVAALWAFLLAVVCYFVVRDLGVGITGGLVAVAVLFVSPAGQLATSLLPEGAVLAALLVTTAGARRLLLGLPFGLALSTGGLLAAYSLKSSNGSAMTLALGAVAAGVAAVALLRRTGPERNDTVKRAVALAGVSGVVTLGWYLVAKVAGYGGIHESLEDLRTWHFHKEPTQSAWEVLLSRNERSLGWWLELFIPPVMPALAVVSLVIVMVVLRSAPTTALWAAVALTGIPLCLLHPVVTNYSRLLVPFWLLPAVAAGCLATEALRRLRMSGAAPPPPP